jgi:mannose-6-phosphate isomerase
MSGIYPIALEPFYQQYVWGGDRIARRFGRKTPPGPIAESWEASDRPEGASTVKNGPLRGKSLGELVSLMGADLVGTGRDLSRFPLLCKLIDARENLSVQVHPKEAGKGGEPKSELWYALDPSPILIGIKAGVVPEAFADAVKAKRADQTLEETDLAAGEVLFVPGGCVHALLSGSFVLEVQHNANTTFRLYDWARNDPARPLHLKEGLAAIDWEINQQKKVKPRRIAADFHYVRWLLHAGADFQVERIELFQHWDAFGRPKTFQLFFPLTVESGHIEVGEAKEPLRLGEMILVPAAAPRVALSGRAELIRISLPF